MTTITATKARADIFKLIRRVCEDHDPVTINSKGGNAVLVDADDYASMLETFHLLRNPVNAARLLQGIAQAEGREFADVEWPNVKCD